jgi:hypothetical protein
MHGDYCTASFFAPFNRMDEPYIRIATGDYEQLRATAGRNDALAAFICSLAHEVVHYQQWVAGEPVRERGVAVKARSILRRYSATVDEP